jgi:hypothetical protein
MTGFLADARNDKKERAERHRPCHAERSEASMSGFLADARNDIFGLVMLNEVKHPYWIPR